MPGNQIMTVRTWEQLRILALEGEVERLGKLNHQQALMLEAQCLTINGLQADLASCEQRTRNQRKTNRGLLVSVILLSVALVLTLTALMASQP